MIFFTKKTLVILIVTLFLGTIVSVALFKNDRSVYAQTEQAKLDSLVKQIEQYEAELGKIINQANTLTNEVARFDAQIKLATLKIQQTEEKISLLSGRITQLIESLDSLKNAFKTRVNQTYKMSKVYQPYLLLSTSHDLLSAISSFHYLQKIQESDVHLLNRLENAQVTYQKEKVQQEELQVQLENQKISLDSQKAAKANLLTQTKNDERKYQELLAAAKAEFEAIQAIIAGKGTEEDAGKVNQGDRIASIIQGTSCNSSGTHLHFIVRQSGSTLNPFNYLKPIDYENCSGSSCGSGNGDSFNPTGSWDWPLNPTIKYTQGYGSTWAVRNTWVGRIYVFHNGIDINSGSGDVKAVKSGNLYRGSYGGYKGCRLRYVRVDHDDSDIDTLYLHINY